MGTGTLTADQVVPRPPRGRQAGLGELQYPRDHQPLHPGDPAVHLLPRGHQLLIICHQEVDAPGAVEATAVVQEV